MLSTWIRKFVLTWYVLPAITQAALASSTCGHTGQQFPGGAGRARAPHVNTGHVYLTHAAVPFMQVQSVHGSTRNGLK